MAESEDGIIRRAMSAIGKRSHAKRKSAGEATYRAEQAARGAKTSGNRTRGPERKGGHPKGQPWKPDDPRRKRKQ